MRQQDLIADAVLGCKPLVARYFAGFTDENHTAQPPGLPNHLAWSLGHLALTMHRAAEKIDGQPTPAADFRPGRAESRAGAAPPSWFHAEDVCFGSTPTPERSRYPGVTRCIEVFNNGCDRTAEAVRGAADATLDQTTRWGAGETTLRALALRMVFHNGTHTGQIADLRRALGLKSVFS